MSKIVRVSHIHLHRAEGPSAECVSRDFTNWTNANAQLISWRNTAPKKGHGYDKVDLKVTWEDGETYEGRIDIQEDVLETVEQHIWETLRFYSGLWRPAHLTKEQYDAVLQHESQESRDACVMFLAIYDLGFYTQQRNGKNE